MKKVALLFPGQGSQYVGMGKKLSQRFKVAKQVFEEANDILGFDLMNLCFQGNDRELTETKNTQPALLTASVAAYRVFTQYISITPKFLAGHSLGEISALTCSGTINFSDAIKIVRQRGQLMQEAVAFGTGTMSAISNLDKNIIEEECKNCSTEDNFVTISNYNSPSQIVISGNVKAVETVGERLRAFGAKVTPLKVSGPFHSPLMKLVAANFNEELQKYKYHRLEYPVISNVTAMPYKSDKDIVKNLTLQLTMPVQWQATMKYIQENGVETAVEIGPGTVLRNLSVKNAPNIQAFAYDNEEDIILLKRALSINDCTKTENAYKPTIISRALAAAVCIKNTNWNNDEYQKGVIEPYQKIKRLQEQIEKQGVEPSFEQSQEALEMLRSVFITKKTPRNEQIELFHQIFKETGTIDVFTDFKL